MTTPLETSTETRQAKQSRSQATYDRLLRAGQRLIEQRGYDDMTIQDIAATARCSIGAFYHHFATKEAFYVALVQRSVDEVRQALYTTLCVDRYRGLGQSAIVHATVEFVAQAFRDRQGVVRAALKKSMDEPEAWNPIRELGREITAQVITLLTTACHGVTSDSERFPITMAMQVIYSTLLNAVINRSGPLLIEDDELVRQLAHIAVRYLEAPLPASFSS